VALDQTLVVIHSHELAEGLDQFRNRRERPELLGWTRCCPNTLSNESQERRRDEIKFIARMLVRKGLTLQ
jgi:hypothetical protein